MKKGFIYTLESVIASTLVLSMVIVVLPDTGPDPQPDFSTVRSGLVTLENRGSFDTNLTTDHIDSKTDKYVPEGFNHSSVIYKSKNNISSVTAEEKIYINESGYSADIQFWVESANGLNVSYNGKKLLEEVNTPGYSEKTVKSTDGWLNFTGTGTVDYSFNTYQKLGSSPEEQDVRSENILTFYERNREVQIKIW